MQPRVLSAVLLYAAACHGAPPIAGDGTLGTVIKHNGSAWTIKGGTQLGGNLFQSFSQFNVLTGQSATFSGPNSVLNIVGRVTGPDPSSIDGLLRSSIPGANLWLMNPRGVMFGPHADLDVTGSFHVTTADYLKLGSSGQFNATNPGASTLVSAPPSAFGFLGPVPGPISFGGTLFATGPGLSLSIVGGDIAIRRSGLKLPGGRISLVAAAGAGEVALTPDGVSTSAGLALGGISIENSDIEADSFNGTPSGAVFVRAGRLTLTNAGISSFNKLPVAGGGIDIELRGALTLSQGSDVTTDAHARGIGGAISIAAGAVTLGRDSLITASTSGSGNAGNVSMRAGTISVDGGSIGAQQAGSASSTGNAGAVHISGGDLTLTNGGQISSGTFGAGRGGEVAVSMSGRVSISGHDTIQFPSGIFSGSSTRATGDGGSVSVQADTIDISRAGSIGGATSGSGNGGSVTVQARQIRVSGGGSIQAQQVGFAGSTGIAGDVRVSADELTLASGGEISSGTFAAGRGGNVTVAVKGKLSLAGSDSAGFASGIFSGAHVFGTGDAGAVLVMADSIDVARDATISATTYGAGNGGNVTVGARNIRLSSGGTIESQTQGSGGGGAVEIAASGMLSIRGVGPGGSGLAGIFGDATRGASGHAGSVTVSAGVVNIVREGQISADTKGSGDAGNLSVAAQDIRLRGAGSIESSTFGSGRGGNVSVTAGGSLDIAGQDRFAELSGIFATSRRGATGDGGQITASASDITLANRGAISASSLGSGRAGSITITAANRLSLLEGGTISTSAKSSDGGDITIRAGNLVYLKDSQISTSVNTSTGSGGNISIDPVFVVLDHSQIIAQAAQGRGGNISIVSQFFLSDSSLVDASSEKGISGNVQIAAPRVDVNSSLTALNANYLDASSLIRESCAARAGRTAANSFTGTGRGGLAQAPGQIFMLAEKDGMDRLALAPAAGSGCL